MLRRLFGGPKPARPRISTLQDMLRLVAASPERSDAVLAVLAVLNAETLMMESADQSGATPATGFLRVALNDGDLALLFTDEEALHRRFPGTTHQHSSATGAELFEMLLELGFIGARIDDGSPWAFELQADAMGWVVAGLLPRCQRPHSSVEGLVSTARLELGAVPEVTAAFVTDAPDRLAQHHVAVVVVGIARWPRPRRQALLEQLRARLEPLAPGLVIVSLPTEPSAEAHASFVTVL
jgi:hypothetical protein